MIVNKRSSLRLGLIVHSAAHKDQLYSYHPQHNDSGRPRLRRTPRMKFLLPDSPGTPHTLPKHSQDKTTKSSGLGSASVQSHPSSVVSRARLRNPGASSDNLVIESDLEANGLGLASWSFFRWQHGLPSLWPLEWQYFGLRPGRHRYLKWFLVLYSFCSVVLFTTFWWNLAFGGSAFVPISRLSSEIGECSCGLISLRSLLMAFPDPPKESVLQDISSQNLLSKLTTVNSELKNLDPFVLNPRVDPDTVTACLWTKDSDLPLVHSWAGRWSGMFSCEDSFATKHQLFHRRHLTPCQNAYSSE